MMNERIDYIHISKVFIFALSFAFFINVNLSLILIPLSYLFYYFVIYKTKKYLAIMNQKKSQFKNFLEGICLISREEKTVQSIILRSAYMTNISKERICYDELIDIMKKDYTFITAEIFVDLINEANGKNDCNRIVSYLKKLSIYEFSKYQSNIKKQLDIYCNLLVVFGAIIFFLKISQNYYILKVLNDKLFIITYLTSVLILIFGICSIAYILRKNKNLSNCKKYFSFFMLVFYAYCSVHTPYVAYQKALDYYTDDKKKRILEDSISAFELRNPEYLFENLNDDELFGDSMIFLYDCCTKNTINNTNDDEIIQKNFKNLLEFENRNCVLLIIKLCTHLVIVILIVVFAICLMGLI